MRLKLKLPTMDLMFSCTLVALAVAGTWQSGYDVGKWCDSTNTEWSGFKNCCMSGCKGMHNSDPQNVSACYDKCLTEFGLVEG